MCSAERELFGTDGIRGRFGVAPIDVNTVQKLGWAAGQVLAKTSNAPVLIARDTRASGVELEAALVAGLNAAGVSVALAGVLPTPAVAYLTRSGAYAAGLMITASHNPHHDNGIKFFSPQGMKLSDDIELAIEAAFKTYDVQSAVTPASQTLQNKDDLQQYASAYQAFCHKLVDDQPIAQRLKIVVDCANGAMSAVAPSVLRSLGAEIILLGAEPDGVNINAQCGSNHPAVLTQKVLETGADLGIAFDGDGDRVVLIDAQGKLVDGDQILFILAMAAQQAGTLQGGVVGTRMSNMGLEVALKEKGIAFARTRVGDRYVIEHMLKNQDSLGGEGSGHIICKDAQPTGDGLVGALKVLHAMHQAQKTLAMLCEGMQKMPQCLINVSADRSLVSHPEVEAASAEIEQQLNGHGRVLLRASGTEPLIRVMVEGTDAVLIQTLAKQLAQVVEQTNTQLS